MSVRATAVRGGQARSSPIAVIISAGTPMPLSQCSNALKDHDPEALHLAEQFQRT